MQSKAKFANPIDPNLAISAHTVFPQLIRPYPPGKTAVFPEFFIFFQIRSHQNVRTVHRGPIYQIKAHERPYQTHFSFDK